MGSLRGREVWAIPPCLHRCGECGKKFIKPLMKGDLTAASISSLKLGPPSPSAKKATGTLDVLTDWMGEDEWGKAKDSERPPSPARLQGDGRREEGTRGGPGAHPRVQGRGHFPQRAGAFPTEGRGRFPQRAGAFPTEGRGRFPQRAGAFPTEGRGRFPQPSGDARRGAARGGRGWYGPSAWNPQPLAESGSSALESQRKQGLYGVMFLFLL